MTTLLDPDESDYPELIAPDKLKSTLDSPEMRANRAAMAEILGAKVETYDWMQDMIELWPTLMPHPDPCGPGARPDRALLANELAWRGYTPMARPGWSGVPSC